MVDTNNQRFFPSIIDILRGASATSQGEFVSPTKTRSTLPEAQIPPAPVGTQPTLGQAIQGPVLPSPENLPLQDRAAIFNRAQIQVGLAPQTPQIPAQKPSLVQAVQRTGLPAYDNQSALVRAPKGYTAPTPEEIATAQAVSDAYWAPYRRATQMQDYDAQTARLKALGPYQQKAPTLRDQLFGKAYEAAEEQYKLNAAAAETVRDPGWFAGDAEHEKARAKARLKAREDFLKDLRYLAQPGAAQADLTSPDKD